MLDVRVISIGTFAAHPLWGERTPVRTGHSTTVLIRTEGAVILVDPGLPEPAIVARLSERANIKPAAVTHVFLTSFTTDRQRGITAFPNAKWLVSKAEREGVGIPLIQGLKHAAEKGHAELRQALERDVSILQRCEEAPEQLAEGVDIFPLPGVSPGLTGLLLELEQSTTLICGDAVASVEHLAQRKIVPWATDVEAATSSFNEAVEIADWLVLGRDNIVTSPGAGSPYGDLPD